MDQEEKTQRLSAISEMIDNYLNSGRPLLTYTEDFLEKIQNIALGTDTEPEHRIKKQLDHVIISCDASVKENPGGPSAVGFVIQYKTEKPMQHSTRTKSVTSNQAEYDAVYEGLTFLMSIKNNPGCEIEVRSDSRLIIDQLNGKIKCNDKDLQRRRDLIRELVLNLPVPVNFQWRPRNSTPELELANWLAQDELGVRRH